MCVHITNNTLKSIICKFSFLKNAFKFWIKHAFHKGLLWFTVSLTVGCTTWLLVKLHDLVDKNNNKFCFISKNFNLLNSFIMMYKSTVVPLWHLTNSSHSISFTLKSPFFLGFGSFWILFPTRNGLVLSSVH